MSRRPASYLLPVLLLPLLLPLVFSGGRCCAAEPAKLPEGVVALVAGKRLTSEGFYTAVVQLALPDIKTSRAGPRHILEQLIEELMVAKECERLGLVVTEADVQRQWNDWDRRLRVNSNGERTLRDTIREEGSTTREFRVQIRAILNKEAVARHPSNLGHTLPKNDSIRLNQVGIVIKKLRDRTQVVYGLELLEHAQQGTRPTTLPKGVVATVNGQPITEREFGQALVIRLPGGEVREYLERECKTAVMSLQGIRITDEEFDAEIEHLRKEWPLWRQLQREELWSTVSFKDRFKAYHKGGVKHVRQSRYQRGLIALVQRMRAEVTEEDVLKEFAEQRDTHFGEHIVVTDIQIRFAQEGGLMSAGRKRSMALRMARDLVVRLESGESFEKVAKGVNNRKDRSFQAKRIRLYKSNKREVDGSGAKVKGRMLDRDSGLYEQAVRLRDGDVTSPFETLTDVHLMRREDVRPARTLDEVRSYIVAQIARRKAREWINERIKDPKYVQMRWPLSERQEPKRRKR